MNTMEMSLDDLSKYKIKSVPTFILEKDGKEIWSHRGSISYQELTKVIDDN